MADLVIKTQCKSWLRQSTDTFLNVTFPLWGLVAPVVFLVIFMALFVLLQSNEIAMLTKDLPAIGLFLGASLGALLLKRAMANDFLVVNKNGITLPAFMGGRVGLKRHLPWRIVRSIDASIIKDEAQRSRLNIFKENGKIESVPIKDLPPEFVEQLLLAMRMWAPDKCAPNLDQLQTILRIGARESSQPSYTDLWEDELSRRFCPTQYVPLEPGRVLRNSTLKIVRQLATGGLSALYLCQIDGGRLVVLKEASIPSHGSDELKAKAREMFDREAQLLMKVDHPGIVHVLDCFVELDRNYMILEYVNGTDLWQLVRQNGPQREADVLEWAVQLATTLKVLHDREQPIIHRDVTPDNIILRNDGKVVLVDFGAANEFIGTATGTFVGKHSFIAPEQLRGKATIHSDIYAFGCTLYFLLVGSEPEAFATSNVQTAQAEAQAANPELRITPVSDELCELIESCTQLEASDRYQNVSQLLPVLKRLSSQLAV
ncbi:hypothetical protein BH11CYA1_BH11CYA1_09050 [soil metagenome]